EPSDATPVLGDHHLRLD
nr:minor PKPI=20 kda Kunitz-type proteinase inhibitor {N-terminal} [Solanum tuberosum=potatoes, cv. Irish Cobbler, tubers, Peptide Partial, 17 aa] [Solanum tuberosum]